MVFTHVLIIYASCSISLPYSYPKCSVFCEKCKLPYRNCYGMIFKKTKLQWHYTLLVIIILIVSSIKCSCIVQNQQLSYYELNNIAGSWTAAGQETNNRNAGMTPTMQHFLENIQPKDQLFPIRSIQVWISLKYQFQRYRQALSKDCPCP